MIYSDVFQFVVENPPLNMKTNIENNFLFVFQDVCWKSASEGEDKDTSKCPCCLIQREDMFIFPVL